MKEKIFRLLFPLQARKIVHLSRANERLVQEINTLKQKGKHEPSLADIMRDTLGIVQFDLGNIDLVDQIEHPINSMLSKEVYERRLGELSAVFKNETFRDLCKYLMTVQMDFSLKKATDELQIYLGRFSCNGISMVWNEVKKAHTLFEEVVKPPDSFDEHKIISEI